MSDGFGETTPAEAYESIHRAAEIDDLDPAAVRAGSIDLHRREMQALASRLDVYPSHYPSAAELRTALGEAGVFRGPVGDDTLYIHTDGETYRLEDYPPAQRDSDD